jgi:hypothetical protein
VPKPRHAQHSIGAKEATLKLISVPRRKTKIGAELNLKYAPKERQGNELFDCKPFREI